MKPWPAMLRAMFPMPPLYVPERPWWRGTFGTPYTRTDGLVLPLSMSGGVPRWRLPTKGEPPYDTLDKLVAMRAWDANRPVLHPGVRPGQVWARDIGGTMLDVHSILDGDSAGNVVTRSRQWSYQDAQAFFRDAFLVSDAACPHLAPWAPPLDPDDPVEVTP